MPEIARVLALKGAQFLAIPTAMAYPPDVEAPQSVALLPARAAENAVGAAYVNYYMPDKYVRGAQCVCVCVLPLFVGRGRGCGCGFSSRGAYELKQREALQVLRSIVDCR